MTQRPRAEPLRLAIVFLCTIVLGIAFAQTQTMGLADNGDFSRLTLGVVSRPETQAIEAPQAGTPAYDLRFYDFWIPRWHEAFSPGRFTSTSPLLWLPGIFIGNSVHPQVVSLPLVAAGSKAIVLIAYAGFLVFFARGVRATIFFAVSLGTLLSASDYAVYYNTFYAEGPSGVYFLLALVALYAFVCKPTFFRATCYFIALTLLAASKLQYVYLWPLGFGLAVCAAALGAAATRRNVLGLIALGVVIGAAPIYTLVARSADLALFRYNDYDRIYDGMLVFADDPRALLAAIGATDPACIGTIAFEPVGVRCAATHPNSIARANALRLLVADPRIVPRMIGFAADSMQDLSLEYLGKYERGDPRAIVLPATGPSSWESSHARDFYSQFAGPPLNAWSALKYAFFPRGRTLLAYYVVALGVFVFAGTRSHDLGLRAAGASSVVVSCTQLVVDVFGDGREEIIKHLYLANLAFDVSLILFAAYAFRLAAFHAAKVTP